MDCSSKFRELCIPLYRNYILSGVKFPITKYTPRKKSSGLIYYIKLTISSKDIQGNYSKKVLYKIGYTSRTVQHRINTLNLSSNIKVKVIAILKFNKVVDAYHVEQLLHKEYGKWNYKGKKVIESGYTELYVKDVLGFDI